MPPKTESVAWIKPNPVDRAAHKSKVVDLAELQSLLNRIVLGPQRRN
jgi:hypothetical protein